LLASVSAIANDTPLIAVDIEWMLNGSQIILDQTGHVFLLLTAIIWWAAAMFAFSDARTTQYPNRFYFCFFLAMAGNMGVTFAGDIASFYTLFALMSFAAYGLIATGDDAESIRAGRVYMTLVIIGEILLFSAFVVAAPAGGATILQWQTLTPVAATVPLLVLGFGVKLGVIPWHFVLPVTYRVAPHSAAVALSGAMLSAGVLGLLRFLPLGQTLLAEWGGTLVVMGLIASFMGVVFGLLQKHPKALLGYSSVSQVGLMTALLGLALISPLQWQTYSAVILIYVLHHALAKSALFYAAGIKTAGGPGLYYWHCFALVLPAISIAGAPMTTGALAKTAFKSSLTTTPETWGAWFAWLLPLSSIATSLLLIRFLYLAWPMRLQTGKRSYLTLAGQAGLILSVLCGAWFVTDAFVPGLISATMTPKSIWASAWPVLIAVVAYFSVAWFLKTRTLSLPVVPVGDILPALETALRLTLQKLQGLSATIAEWFEQTTVKIAAVTVPNDAQKIETLLRRPLYAGVLFALIFIGLLLSLGAAAYFFN
jgi:formate hydrogenlyase subunit 3/multisubunit Na+/H+ antiporter MnhD subunit